MLKRFPWWLRALQVLMLTLCVLASLVVTGSVSYGQTQKWSQPIPLSPREPSSWFPDITTDLAGGLHVFWSTTRGIPESKTEAYDAVAYCRPTVTGCVDLVEVAALKQSAGSFNTRPAAVVDSQGTIHMLWRGKTVIYYTSASIRKSASARSWLPPRRISGPNTAYYLNIAQDQRGVLHAVWSENMPQNESDACLGCSDIFYRQSDDLGQTWSVPVDLSNTAWGSEKPHIAIGPDGAIYVAWEEGHEFYNGNGQPSSSMIVASLDGGLTWEKPTTFIFPSDTPQSIAIGVDGEGKVVVVWRQVVGEGIFYQISTDHGRSWTVSRQMPGVLTRSLYNDLDDYDMAVDAAGHLHLVLVGRDPQSLATLANRPSAVVPNSVYHLEWDGNSWSEPTPIFTAEGDMPEWPRIAVSNGNQLHVVWFVRDEAHVWDSDNAKYQVWYAHGLSSAPAATPVTWPIPTSTSVPEVVTTPIPVATPTLLPTPTSTLDPSLTQVDIPPGTTDSIYTEVDDLILLAKSLVPAALVIVAVMIGVRTWRR